MNTFNGTRLLTKSTARALIVIYCSKVIYNLNCAVGTSLFALTASDTAVLTSLAYNRALAVAVTYNEHTLGVFYKVDYAVGTF